MNPVINNPAMNPAGAADKLQLRDIHLPASPDFWPPAPGWWIVATLLLLVVAWTILKLLARRRRQRRLQMILKELQPIEQKLLTHPDNQTLAELNILLRRLALMTYQRSQIASLNGKQWLAFLDRSGNTNKFTQGVGKVLSDAPYLPNDKQSLSKKDAQALLKLVRNWIAKVTSPDSSHLARLK